ncbi:MAG: hypothetical protein ACI8RZ_006011 [Myxococcota bacterium]|jgi:hypothetical protein
MCLPLLMLVMMGCSERVYPESIPERRAPSSAWKRLVEQATTGAGTDYDLIASRRDILDSYLVWIGKNGPEENDMRGSQSGKKIAFLVNAYNAAVVAGVLRNREAASVMDVSAGLFPSGGAGFFLGQTFRIDAEWVTLYHLEHQYLLGAFEEPLIHAGLNCASTGCPPLRYYSASKVDEELAESMRDFLASDQGIRPIEGGYEVTELMSWYEDQFIDWSDATDLCGYMADYTEGAVSEWLAEQEPCALTFFTYDWSVNHAPAAPEPNP